MVFPVTYTLVFKKKGPASPCRSVLPATERENLLAIPDAKGELIRLYTLNDADLSRIRQHRGAATHRARMACPMDG